jgi:hypothetical protein
MEHYRAHIVYCSTMVHAYIRGTVEFFPQHCKVPGISSADAAAIAAADLTQELLQPKSNDSVQTTSIRKNASD